MGDETPPGSTSITNVYLSQFAQSHVQSEHAPSLAQLHAQTGSLKKKLIDTQLELSEVEEKNRQLVFQINDLKTQLAQSKESVAGLRATFEAQIEELRGKVELREQEIRTLSKAKEDGEKLILELKKHIADLMRSGISGASGKDGDQQKIKDTQKAFQLQLDIKEATALQNEIRRLTLELQDYKLKYESEARLRQLLTQESEETKRSLAAQVNEYKSKMRELTKEHSSLDTKVHSLEVEVLEVKKALAEALSAKTNADIRYKKLKELLTKEMKERDSLTNANRELTERCKEFKQRAETEANARSQLALEIATLKRSSEAAIKALKVKHMELAKEKEALASSMKKLSAELADAKRRLSQNGLAVPAGAPNGLSRPSTAATNGPSRPRTAASRRMMAENGSGSVQRQLASSRSVSVDTAVVVVTTADAVSDAPVVADAVDELSPSPVDGSSLPPLEVPSRKAASWSPTTSSPPSSNGDSSTSPQSIPSARSIATSDSGPTLTHHRLGDGLMGLGDRALFDVLRKIIAALSCRAMALEIESLGGGADEQEEAEGSRGREGPLQTTLASILVTLLREEFEGRDGEQLRDALRRELRMILDCMAIASNGGSSAGVGFERQLQSKLFPRASGNGSDEDLLDCMTSLWMHYEPHKPAIAAIPRKPRTPATASPGSAHGKRRSIVGPAIRRPSRVGVAKPNSPTALTGNTASEGNHPVTSTLVVLPSPPATALAPLDSRAVSLFQMAVIEALTKSTVDTIDCNPYNFSHDELFVLFAVMLDKLGVLSKFELPYNRLLTFLRSVEACYRANPYHNFRHAFDVAQMVFLMLYSPPSENSGGGGVGNLLTDVDKLALMVASICHDLDHPGVNNAFQMRSRSALAILYNDSSPLENHHCAMAFSIISRPEANILAGLTEDQFASARKLMIDAILNTDMAYHFELTNKFVAHVDGTNSAGATEGKPRFSPEDEYSRKLLASILLHAADVGNVVRPFQISKMWSDLVFAEFLHQGDLERERGFPISPFMDRNTADQKKLTLSFMDFVVLPLFSAVAKVVPKVASFVENIRENRKVWEAMPDVSVPQK